MPPRLHSALAVLSAPRPSPAPPPPSPFLQAVLFYIITGPSLAKRKARPVAFWVGLSKLGGDTQGEEGQALFTCPPSRRPRGRSSGSWSRPSWATGPRRARSRSVKTRRKQDCQRLRVVRRDQGGLAACALLLVVVGDGAGLGVVRREALAEGVGVVVRALDERLARDVVRHGLLGGTGTKDKGRAISVRA